MKAKLIPWLVCPIDRTSLRLLGDGPADPEQEIEQGYLVSENGRAYPIVAGVPRLIREAATGVEAAEARQGRDDPGAVIGQSFSAEWDAFDYETSRTWHDTLEERRQLFLKETDSRPGDLIGKVVFDAGCGNGTLSEGIAEFGCDVIAVDVSESVYRAHRHFKGRGTGRVHFVQGSLLDLPVRDRAADLIFSSGVLHHNPDTLQAFRSVIRALKPGGKIYIWVYHREPGLKFRLQLMLRGMLAPLPFPIKKGFVYAWSTQSMLRQQLRTMLRLNDEKDRLTWRERVVDLMDIYTPRYRWMHTQEEVHGWYRELGFRDVKTSEVRDWGFGVVGQLAESPAAVENAAR